ncbi:MAG: hypothetical protein QF566_02715 [Candidatus Thalassarchaeaceae archaeon]|nr:hypothetical protein [Candidatus Thalassarchaeaceae archaeon]|tara:strand:- start:32 stop:622 length:591 start_codon:yes stop_codon:yes gene_type:complete
MPLPELSPLTHLAVAEGCGGTTMAMQFARDAMLEGGRVIWICETTPDSMRFSQIFDSVEVIALARLHLHACGEALAGGIDDARKLSTRLTPQLVIIDDWTPRIGQADKLAIKSIVELQSTLDSKCPILIVSALYGDASGEGEWKVRGQAALDKISATTWLLTITSGGAGGVQKRILNVGDDEQYQLIIGDDGFSSV